MKRKKIRISQCMIVKNEEKNIRRALSWAKDIVFEQIVVDTGSTDRTVEIAREMGAEIYHFQWIDDFAAAKNYAIEQASGDWIAFLDADEYMNREDAKKLVNLLEQADALKPGAKMPLFVRCAWIQLGDNGKPFSVDPQDRIFRNRKDLRYHGKIHEQIRVPQGGRYTFIQAADMLSIFHTGYTKSAYKETGKLQRNIELLERELEEDPENYMAWAYLGDSRRGIGDRDGAKESYKKALEGKDSGKIIGQRYQDARTGLMGILSETGAQAESDEEILKLAEDYGYPSTDNPDPWFFLGLWHYNRNEMEEARENFLQALEKLETFRSYDRVAAQGSMRQMYAWLGQACFQLEQRKEAVRCWVLSLRIDRYQEQILVSVLQLLEYEPGERETAEGTWGFLQGLYDVKSPKDLLFILKCAKRVRFTALETRTMGELPEDIREEICEPGEDRRGISGADV